MNRGAGGWPKLNSAVVLTYDTSRSDTRSQGDVKLKCKYFCNGGWGGGGGVLKLLFQTFSMLFVEQR